MRRVFPLLLALLALSWAAAAVEIPRNKPANDENALLQQLQSQRDMPSGKVEGFVHIPDQKGRVLIQPQGRDFRDFRTRAQPWIDAVLIIVAVGAMLALYLIAGPTRVATDPAGRTIERFKAFERFIHWLTASSFIWLALTGLNMVFGRALLEPLLGGDRFAALSYWAKQSHDAVAFAFMFGLVFVFLLWLRHNIPSRLDWVWIKSAGGMFGGPHPPARKFNAGQKMIYWIVVLGGAAMSLTGLALLLPFYALDMTGMHLVQILHSVMAALMIAAIIGHVYLGTVGIAGSFDAMSTGHVDLNWAREHHGLWVEEEERRKTDKTLPLAAE
ncbi:MAG TPA: formate dehydrogenase subunit gamma [Acetobacteraceae bacterium]|nr:formate dehydrogenase subunit gamma [Acetobacteraceae bacterium]